MEDGTRSVKLSTIIEEFKLEILWDAGNNDNTLLKTLDVHRPGLPLAGFFEHFDADRPILIGRTEDAFISEMDTATRKDRFEKMLSRPIPAVIFTRGLAPTAEFVEAAKKYSRTLLKTEERTSTFMSHLINVLHNHLAPCITRSGVMMEIYGEGVLFQGESGVGKSEVAIELVKRGHRIIADDAVEIRETSQGRLEASAPELIRHFMELRGIGVVDVRSLFGMGAVKERQIIEMVINLEPWQDGKVYDRLGLDGDFIEILGVTVPLVTIPVKPGRNLASIVEVAAMNNRNRCMGFNAAAELTKRMDEHFKRLDEDFEATK